jgi:hypothetical protein
MLRFQVGWDKPVHKGMPLIWISDCHRALNRPVHAKRYLMYSMCEDAIKFDQETFVKESGPYSRAVWLYGITPSLVLGYHDKVRERYDRLGKAALYPERLLAELNTQWMTDSPSETEYSRCWANPLYIRYLLSQLGEGTGENLERLAHYLLCMIPGCRVYHRQKTNSNEYDVVGSFEGPSLDFRTELGRYFVCECKDWNRKANVTVLAKLAYVLDSVKSRFGILFSREGITGNNHTRNAARERLKVFSSRGIAIEVIDASDLDAVASGQSFLEMLRRKYEMVRLDLASEPV